MKKIKKEIYALFFFSLIGFAAGWIFQSSVLGGAVIIAVLIVWGIFLWRFERDFFIPGQKAYRREPEDELSKIVAEEIWESENVCIETICRRLETYVQEEISGINVEMFQKKAEYSALQSQINPHFLYNTLETIRSQALTDGDREIAEMVRRLSSIFRYSISRKGEMVTLRDELNNIRNYMKIMEFRFYDRFALEIDVDEEEGRIYDFYLPRLILQPIVENALSHGLDEVVAGGLVRIEAVVADDLIITVSDNGKGMSLKKLDALNEKIHSAGQKKTSQERDGQEESRDTQGSGIALSNVNQRIQLLYGEKYGLSVYSSENCGTDVELILPVIDKRESGAGEKDIVADQ